MTPVASELLVTHSKSTWRGLITKNISTCKFPVYFWDCSSNLSWKYQPGKFWEYSKEYRKKSISHIDVYGVNGPKWTSFLIFWNILKNTLIYIFVRYLSYGLLKIHRKLGSGYLHCDKASLTRLSHFSHLLSSFRFILYLGQSRAFRSLIFVFESLKNGRQNWKQFPSISSGQQVVAMCD